MTTFWSALVNSVILSLPVALAVWLLLRVAPRQVINAATRYGIWWVVLAVTLLLPLSYASWHRDVPRAPVTAVALPQMVELPVQTVEPVMAPVPLHRVSRPVLPVEVSESPWLRYLLAGWALVSGFLLVRLARSYVSLYRRTRRAVDAPAEWRSVSGRRRVRVALSDEIAIPAASGPSGPTVLIPSRLFEQLGAEDLRQIVRHEAAHLERYDDYALLLQRLIEAVFALHPVVRWVTRQIDLEREIACDDMVAGSEGQARVYADCLIRAVGLCGEARKSLATANVADSGSHLSRRVGLLLHGSRGGRAGMLRGRFGVIAVGLVLVAGGLVRVPKVLAFVPVVERVAVPSVVVAAPAVKGEPVVLAQVEPVVGPKAAVPVPVVVAQAQAQPVPTPQVAPPARGTVPYVLGANDVVGISVWDDKNLTGSYVIGPDGKLSMALIGEITASGLTIPELQNLIIGKLGKFIADPIINVQLLRNNSKKFTLVGGVNKPGPYPLLQETTVLDALVAAGGFRDFANRQKVVVIRGTKRFLFNYEDVLKGERMEQNISLLDGDIVSVPDDGAESTVFHLKEQEANLKIQIELIQSLLNSGTTKDATAVARLHEDLSSANLALQQVQRRLAAFDAGIPLEIGSPASK